MMTPQVPGLRKTVTIGNYRFTGKRLGKGNFAKVEEAVHTALNIKVAVKIMDVNTIKEEYVIKNLLREAKIMSKLSHPSIAVLYQTMQHDSLYYIVTELVNGGDLCNFIKGQRNGKLEESSTRVFARQLISAISHMHNLGIVHRDLKMENIMLDHHKNKIKIVDFGLSNEFSGNNLLRTHCGSPEYAAPELFCEGKRYGPEVDIWSLGVILYGMVMGYLPFISTAKEGASHQMRRKKLLEQINKGFGSSQKKSIAHLSPEFRSLIPKILVVEPTKRLKIMDLAYHPWVTEKGRKLIRTNPWKGLHEEHHNNIMTIIGKINKLNDEDIITRMKIDPFGPTSGMYKILAHQQIQAPTPPPGLILKKQNTSPNVPGKLQPYLLPTAKTPPNNKRHSSITKSSQTPKVSRISSAPNPKLKLDKKYEEAKEPIISKEMRYNLRSKKPSETNNKITDNSYLNIFHKQKVLEDPPKLKIKPLDYAPGGDAENNPPQKNSNNKIVKNSEITTLNSKLKMMKNDVFENVKNIPQRASTADDKNRIEGIRKRSSIPTPIKRVSRKVMSAGVTPSKFNKADECRKRQPYLGNTYNLVDFSNEPIARSIAGYVRNNVSTTLEPLKWMRNVKSPNAKS